MATATHTLKETTRSKKTGALPTGTCKYCFVRRITLTHNVKYSNGNTLRICRRCADATT